MDEKLDVEGNRAIIIPSKHHPPHITSTTGSNKPLGSATRFDWASKGEPQKQPSHHHPIPESESRTCQIRRNSLSQRNLSVKTKLCYRMADLVMVMCLLFPLAIAFWRGVWQLMDHYCKAWGNDPWLSMVIGYSIPFTLHLCQEPLKRTVCLEKMSFPLFYFLSRTILLIHSVGSVNQWRGIWTWLDMEFGNEWLSSTSMMAVGIAFSISFKTLNNILAPPLFCVVDEAKSIHDCPLRFQTSPKKPFQYVLDCFFSVIIIPGVVVFCWRGLWTLADIYLYPENELGSVLASLGIGYSICIVLCLAQPSICNRAHNVKGLSRLVFMDSICILGFVGCVLAWRGVWNGYNLFLHFETPNISEWITVVVGALGTMLFGCISLVVVRGIAIDGALVEDGSGEWLIPYISYISIPIYDVPYPEPWICRFFCTSQKIGGKRRRRQEPIDNRLVSLTADGDTVGNLAGGVGDLTKPLKLGNTHALGNSIHPAATGAPPTEEFLYKNPAAGIGAASSATSNNRFRLSDLPNIDSSSEEELGMRTKMIPPPDDDNKDNNNDNGNNEQQQPLSSHK